MTERDHAIVERPESLPVQGPMHPMAQEILKKNPTPETLRELMQLQRDWEKDNARKAYAAAFVALKAALPPFIDKDAEVDFTGSSGKRTNYRHASFAGVSIAIKDHLAAHGFALFFPDPIVSADGRLITVKARLLHMAGHFEEATLSGPPDESGSKNKNQAVASTVTYLQRYTTLALLGIATKDMPEPGSEPASKPSEEPADQNAALQAMGALNKQGKTKAEIEKYVGRPIEDWTMFEVRRLREWWTELEKAKTKAPASPAPSPTAGAKRPDAGSPEPTGADSPEPDGADLESKCPTCGFKTYDPEAFDNHLQAMGHGHREPELPRTKKR